jgi:hypothetical protein
MKGESFSQSISKSFNHLVSGVPSLIRTILYFGEACLMVKGGEAKDNPGRERSMRIEGSF